VGRSKTGKGRDEVYAAVVGDGSGQRLHFPGGADDAEPVPEPLHRRARYENAPFQRVFGPTIDQAGHGGQQIALRCDRSFAGMHEHEASRAIGILDHTRPVADLAEERCLLIPGDPGDGHAGGEKAGLRPAAHPAGGNDLGQKRRGYPEDVQQVGIPLPPVDVVQQGAGGVACVGHVPLTPGQVPHHPGIHRTEGQLSPFSPAPRPGNGVKNPGEFGA